jgi:plasmid stabilization system protein ParE
MAGMTQKSIDDLVRRASALPREAQEELEEVVTEMEERYRGVYRVADEERAGIERGLEAMREDRYARPEDVNEVLKKARGRMRLRYTEPANTDVAEIVSYLPDQAAGSAASPAVELERGLGRLLRHPFSAQQTDMPGVRRLPLRRWSAGCGHAGGRALPRALRFAGRPVLRSA